MKGALNRDGFRMVKILHTYVILLHTSPFNMKAVFEFEVFFFGEREVYW